MCNIINDRTRNVFGMQQKCFPFEAIGRKSAPDVILRRQVLPAVIQMTAPPHRQWARTDIYPGEQAQTVAGTLNFQCNLHALVGLVLQPLDETDSVFLLLMFVMVKTTDPNAREVQGYKVLLALLTTELIYMN